MDVPAYQHGNVMKIHRHAAAQGSRSLLRPGSRDREVKMRGYCRFWDERVHASKYIIIY